jgi:hypothetical protein
MTRQRRIVQHLRTHTLSLNDQDNAFDEQKHTINELKVNLTISAIDHRYGTHMAKMLKLCHQIAQVDTKDSKLSISDESVSGESVSGRELPQGIQVLQKANH